MLDKLNPVQRKAVENTKGPVIIIAGAGSGKTRVLTYRIAHLINKGINPFNILSLTFTNKAAKEMKERIDSILKGNDKSLWMGTFHSIFSRILRVESKFLGYPSDFTIYDSQDSANLVSRIIKEMNLDKDIYKPKQVLGRISKYKNNLITVKSYLRRTDLQEYDSSIKMHKFGEIYKNYVDRCFKSGAMDFDDLLLKTNELFTRFPEVLQKYQDRFHYIMVDEYQDTNHSQYLIVKALASKFRNVCVVGDDAQSIYSFRGANIQNILNFQSDYSDAKMFRLEQNYRSSKNIVGAANSVIKHNKKQLKKDVWTSNSEGEKIKVYKAFSDIDEASFISRIINDEKRSEEFDNKDFAILYRTNSQSRAIEDSLIKNNIPYRIYGGLSFYQRKEIKDVIAYLKMVINPSDEEAFMRIVNYPTRGIGATTIAKISASAQSSNKSLFEVSQSIKSLDIVNLGTQNKLFSFAEMMNNWRVTSTNLDAFEIANEIMKTSGMMSLIGSDKSPEGVSRYENIQELLNGIKSFVEEQKEQGEGFLLTDFLENIALITDSDKAEDDNNKVSLMTIHASKGLEFAQVFVTGMEENLFPSMMSMNSVSEIEEERRLFYVALTRAEKKAYLTYTISRFRWGRSVFCEPSRFLKEVDESFLDILNADDNTSGRDDDFEFEKLFSKPKKSFYRTPNYSKKQAQKPVEKFVTTQPKGLKKVSDISQVFSSNTDIKTGDRVEHARFGKGVVKDVIDVKAVIDFENTGEKKLLLKYAKLKVL